jgi:hypothetical protein
MITSSAGKFSLQFGSGGRILSVDKSGSIAIETIPLGSDTSSIHLRSGAEGIISVRTEQLVIGGQNHLADEAKDASLKLTSGDEGVELIQGSDGVFRIKDKEGVSHFEFEEGRIRIGSGQGESAVNLTAENNITFMSGQGVTIEPAEANSKTTLTLEVEGAPRNVQVTVDEEGTLSFRPSVGEEHLSFGTDRSIILASDPNRPDAGVNISATKDGDSSINLRGELLVQSTSTGSPSMLKLEAPGDDAAAAKSSFDMTVDAEGSFSLNSVQDGSIQANHLKITSSGTVSVGTDATPGITLATPASKKVTMASGKHVRLEPGTGGDTVTLNVVSTSAGDVEVLKVCTCPLEGILPLRP